MNVTIAVNTLSRDSGIPNVAVRTANALAGLGVRVSILTLVPGTREDLDPRIPVASVFPRTRGAYRLISSGWTAPVAGAVARKALAKLAPDVVMVHYPPLDRCFAVARRRYKLVYFYHNVTDPELYEGSERARRRKEDARILSLLPRCDAVVTNSRFTAAKVQDRCGILATVIHPGVDLSVFKGPSVPPPARQIVSVGRIVPHKGILELLDAFPLIRKEFPPVKLRIVGKSDGDAYYARAMEKAASMEGVELVGELPTDALVRELAASAVFVSCSLFEGFGMPFLEAAACGVPSVGFRVGGIPEALEEGKTGFLADKGDLAGISAQTVRLLKDMPLRRAMHAAGPEWARRFTWESRARETLGLCERLLAGRRA